MDASAISLARESSIPIIVFSVHAPGALLPGAARARAPHTIITEEAPRTDERSAAGSTWPISGSAWTAPSRCCARSAGPAHRARLGQPARADRRSRPTAAEMPLNQVGTVSVPEPRMLTVQVWDRRWSRRSRRRSATLDSASTRRSTAMILRVPMPELTPGAAQRAGQGRRTATPSRRGSRSATCAATAWTQLKRLEKDGDISQDEHKQLADEVQELTDRQIEDDQRHAGDQGKGDHDQV